MKLLSCLLIGMLTFSCMLTTTSRDIVYLVDVTGSVATDVQLATITAVKEASGHLRRGDTLTIIPITSDVALDAPGRIMRFRASTTREPYDADLRRLSQDIDLQFSQFLKTAGEHPFPHTDLLGTIYLASEELAARQQSGTEQIIICLSDLIQDDAVFDFKRDARLAHPDDALTLATSLAQDTPGRFQNMKVFLGSVPSIDLRNLSKTRREAIRVFWMELVRQQGGSVDWATDGAGQLSRLLGQPDRTLLGR